MLTQIFRSSETISEASFNRNRAVVATWLAEYCIQFWLCLIRESVDSLCRDGADAQYQCTILK